MSDGDNITVLLVDDEPASIHSLAHLLGDTHSLRVATNGIEAMTIIEENEPPDIILLDWVMPEMDGLEVVRRIHNTPMEQQPYIVMLTSRNAQEDVITGLKAGADDYLTKPYNPHELTARVDVAERIVRLQKRLATQARTDALTGIFNRMGVLAALDNELARCKRESSLVMTVVLIDVDHFKHVNDNHGHQAGDDVLRELAARCSGSLRSYDIMGRYGGEEFLVIFPGSAHGIEMSERLRNTVATTTFNTRAGALQISISLGVAVVDGTWNADDILAAADRALYDAKESGRNRSCLFRRPAFQITDSAIQSHETRKTNLSVNPPTTSEVPKTSAHPVGKLRLLIVDDEPGNIHMLADLLTDDYIVQVAVNGKDAVVIAESDEPPDIILLDWMMPEMDGLEVVQRICTQPTGTCPYIIMLTGRDDKADIVKVLNAGADDYLTKPYDPPELRARIDVAERFVTARKELAVKIVELQNSIDEIKTLRGIIPICSFCKSVRDDQGYWDQVEIYVHNHSDAEFSHGICPTCMQKHYPEYAKRT